MPDDRLDLKQGDQQQASGYTSKPVPDPTLLTTQALYREVAALQELVETRLASLKDLYKAEIGALDERVEREFELIERQRVETKEDNKDALQAAFAAAKEVTQKSEDTFTKQIDALSLSFDRATETLRLSIDEVKNSIQEVDRKASSIVSEKAGAGESRAGLYAALAGATALLGFIIIIANILANR